MKLYKFDKYEALIYVLSILLVLFYVFLSLHIDFHPDEAIYYDAIPYSTRNDSGFFYSSFYGVIWSFLSSPEGARVASAVLAGLSFLFLIKIFDIYFKRSIFKLFLVFLVFAISYQAIFVFIRVRPEAAWWFCSIFAVYAVSAFEQKRGQGDEIWLSILIMFIALVLIPMNHRLSWFSASFFAAYVALFYFKQENGLKIILLGWSAVLLGVVLNILLGALLSGVPVYQAFLSALNSPHTDRSSFEGFLDLVFHGAPFFLNDTASEPNFFQMLFNDNARWLSHAFIQNTFWGLMIFLPLMGRNWKERYVFSFPLFAFFAFWFSGYYNPTYSAGFSLYVVISFLFIALSTSGWRRNVSLVVVLLSVVNGASFLFTRVLNHGEATYFQVEREIYSVATKLPPGSKVALPERYTPAVSGLKVVRIVDYKEKLPKELDLLVTDSYDRLMYNFVPDFKQKKLELQKYASKMCLIKKFELPVYLEDKLFGVSLQNAKNTAGSWFFRNSVGYEISLYSKCIKNDK